MTKPVLYAVIGGFVGLALLGGLIFWLRTRGVEERGVTPTTSTQTSSDAPRTGETVVFDEAALRKNDADLDGLSNQEEQTLGTDPSKSDTDGDGFTDYQEVKVMTTDPKKADPVTKSGRPGLETYQGQGNAKPDVRPLDEIRPEAQPVTPPTPTTAPGSGPNDDPDKDGLTNQQEIDVYKTDPRNPDTDEDGYTDAQEIEKGYNPRGSGMCATPTCIP